MRKAGDLQSWNICSCRMEKKSLNSKVMNTFGYNSGGAIKETCFAGIVKRKTAEARKKEGSIKKLVEEWFSVMMIEFSNSSCAKWECKLFYLNWAQIGVSSMWDSNYLASALCWKQTNVSFEDFLVENQGWCIKGQMLRKFIWYPKSIFRFIRLSMCISKRIKWIKKKSAAIKKKICIFFHPLIK